MRVLILGATGMLGNAMLRLLARSPDLHHVAGTVRSETAARQVPADLRAHLITGVEAENTDSLARAFAQARPDVVVNCIGLIKQLADADDPLQALPINAMLPHRLSRLCALAGARLVHVSTDCVFAGTRGSYRETDVRDATDLYGRSKALGEIDAVPHAITLRTSIIGHELNGANGLVGWFLSRSGTVKGYRKAIFSGLPTVELARVVRDFVLPDPSLSGLYNVAAAPISKHDLLVLVKQHYGHDVEIVPDDGVVIDRSLDGTRFQEATRYVAPAWPALVAAMHDFR
jgi:dTDP-4-dehydrorhamnose reductase